MRRLILLVALAACKGEETPPPSPAPVAPADPCAAADPKPCLDLATDFERGRHRERDVDQARSLLTKLCDRRIGEACLHLAWTYRTDDGAFDPHATDLVRRACDLGFALACTQAGDADLPHRDELYRKASAIDHAACSAGDAWGCIAAQRIALTHATFPGVRADVWTAARAPLPALCSAHVADACHALAVMAAEGLGQIMDPDAEQHFSQLACDAGSASLCGRLAFRAKRAGDDAHADPLFARACDLGDDKACWALGEQLLATDPSRALAIHEKGCDLGDTSSCARAAQLLDQRGDHAKAAPYHSRVCASGFTQACIDLADAATARGDAAGARVQLARACKLGDVARGCAGVAAPLAASCKSGDAHACTDLDAFLATLPPAKRDLAAYDCCRDRSNVGTSPVFAVLDKLKGARAFNANHLVCPDTFDQKREATCSVFDAGLEATYRIANIDGHARVIAIDEQVH